MVLPKSMRLRGYRCFRYLHKEGTRYYGSNMVLRVAIARPELQKIKNNESRLDSIRCAISISNKVSKKAVVRNRLRRLFHNHLRLRLSSFSNPQQGAWTFLSLKPNCMKENSIKLLNECDTLFFKAGILND